MAGSPCPYPCFRQARARPARLVADSNDAGLAFKLVGFYPNMQGGRVHLEVNVDGLGPAEKTGVLKVEKFRILGDQVLNEVVGSADTSRPAIDPERGARRVQREYFDFDLMRVPFSVGHGQFAMEDSYLRGPLVGLTLRGKADYNAKSVNLSGTYIPLQGLNNVLVDVPLLSQLLSGPRAEGIFGITFAIQGQMAQPQVIVNPLAMLTPGIFRGFMELANPDTTVRPVEEAKPVAPAEKRVRASSTTTEGATAPDAKKVTPRAAKPAASQPSTVDGWSSETQPSPSPKKKDPAASKSP